MATYVGGHKRNIPNTHAACIATMSADQNNITQGAYVKIEFDQVDEDIGGDFDTTNNQYIAPYTGFYPVDVNIRVDDANAAGRIILVVTVNGSRTKIIDEKRNLSAHSGLNISGLAYAEKGQAIAVQIFFESVATADVEANGSIFQIYLGNRE